MAIPDSEVTQGRASDEPVFTPPPSMARSASDWATSFIRGLAKGTEGMVGLPGDAVNALSHGSKVASDYISEKIGVDKGPEPSGLTILPSTEQIDKFVGTNKFKPNLERAEKDLKLSPQEKSLYKMHLTNLLGSGGVDNPDGSRSSLKNITVESDGRTYVLPTVYDGKIVSEEEAWKRAKSHLDDFPSYKSEKEASARYDAMHRYMDEDTKSFKSSGRNTIGRFLDTEPETTGGKYAQSVGEFAPGMIGGPGGMVRKGIQAVAGGLASEAGGQAAKEFAPDHETAARVLSGIAGQGLPGTVRKAIAPSNIKPEREAAAEFLKKEGVDVTAGDLSGSKVTKHAEHALGTSPGAGGAYDITRDKINKQFTAAALKHIGEKGEELSPEVLRDASKKIGGEFDGLAARNSVKPDMAYVADALKAQQKYDDLFLNPLHKPLVEKIVEQQMNNVARGDISGKAYQAQASALREIQTGHGDQRVRDFAADMKDALDDAMERSIKKNNPDDLGKWQDARRKYRNLLVLERVAAGGGEDAAAGVVSAPRLRQAIVAEQGRRSYARGYGDFDELARAGNLLLSKPPTSGTSERAFLHAIPAAIGGVVGHTLEGNAGGAAGTMLGVMAPGATGKALMNPAVQGYLKNQIAKKLGVSVEYLDSLRPEMRDKLIREALAEHGRQATDLPPITVEPE